jgi:micrococcal nuclease
MLNLKFILSITIIFFISCKENKPYIVENEHIETLIQQDSVKVISLSDGDSFKVLFNKESYKIRIHGIDAPERNMPFYKTSKSFLASLIFKKYVFLKILDIDKYDRFVADVFLTNQTNIAYEMIKNGMAWHFVKYSDDNNMADFEQIARKTKAGLWIDENPISPWDYRKKQMEQ